MKTEKIPPSKLCGVAVVVPAWAQKSILESYRDQMQKAGK